MTRNDVEHIFDRFYRSDHVRSQNISGHGLGLSLAKLIILAHTGKIKVRTQFTKGTSFIVTIPNRSFHNGI
jgi:signal transduction histidine kinase